MIAFFSNFPHSVEFVKFLYHLRNLSWNQLYSKLFTKEIAFTEFFQKNSDTKILQTSQCVSTITVSGNQGFHTLFCQKFRQSNNFTKEITIQLISRKTFSLCGYGANFWWYFSKLIKTTLPYPNWRSSKHFFFENSCKLWCSLNMYNYRLYCHQFFAKITWKQLINLTFKL